MAQGIELNLEENEDLESENSITYSKTLKDLQNTSKILKSEAKIASELMTKYEDKVSLSWKMMILIWMDLKLKLGLHKN